MLKRGKRTMICWVFIIDQSCYMLADKTTFNTKFPAITVFVTDCITTAAF